MNQRCLTQSITPSKGCKKSIPKDVFTLAASPRIPNQEGHCKDEQEDSLAMQSDNVKQNLKYRFSDSMAKKDTKAFSSIVSNSLKECIFCFSNQQPQIISPGSNSPAPRLSDNLLQGIVKKNLDKYLTSREYYNGKVVTDIIYNENTNLVSIFKDYLIMDDIIEGVLY